MNLPTLAVLSAIALISGNAASTAAVFHATADVPTDDQVIHTTYIREDSPPQKKATSSLQSTKGDKQRPIPKAVRDQSTSPNDMSQDVNTLRTSLQEAKQHIEELERQLAISNLEHAKRRIGELEQRLGARDQEIAALRSTVDEGSRLKSDLVARTEQLSLVNTRTAELEQQLAGKELELARIKAELQQVTQKVDELTPQLTARTEELARTKQSLADLERKLPKQSEVSRVPESDNRDTNPSAELAPDPNLSVTNLLPDKPTRTDLPDASGDELTKVSQTLSMTLVDEIKKGRVALEERRNRLTLTLASGDLFASGEATITPEGTSLIERIATILQKFSYQSIEVGGHTDNIPVKSDPERTFRDNGELSQARAEHASQALINGGVEGNRVKAVGYADTRPIASNETRKGRSKNRRVEIVISASASPGPTAHVQSQNGQKTTQPVALHSPHKP